MSTAIFEQAGIEIYDAKDSYEALQQAGLDWEVEKRDLYYNEPVIIDEGYGIYDNYTIIPKYQGNFRKDNNQFLGISTDRYNILQNKEAFSILDNLKDFNFIKGGVTSNGKKVYLIGDSNNDFYIDGQTDMVKLYYTFIHGHDGKNGIKFLISPMRVVCINQLNYNLNNTDFKFTISHAGNLISKMQTLVKLTNQAHQYTAELQKEIQRQLNNKITFDIQPMLQTLFPTKDDDSKKVVEEKEQAIISILDLYNNKPDLQNYKGTEFGIISAISDYTSHKKPLRETKTYYDTALVSMLEGSDIIEQAREYIANIA